MPWRLILIIVIFAILLSFIGFNLSNTCDISLGFKTFRSVPVFLTIFGSFVLGMIGSLPFIIFGSLKKEKEPKTPKLKGLFKGNDTSTTEKPDDNGPYGID